jgi:hypothetical protein
MRPVVTAASDDPDTFRLHMDCQAIAGPALLLATGFRQCLVIVTDKIGSQSPDIVSQIDVFRKPSNGAIGFRERGAALEHQVLAKF